MRTIFLVKVLNIILRTQRVLCKFSAQIPETLREINTGVYFPQIPQIPQIHRRLILLNGVLIFHSAGISEDFLRLLRKSAGNILSIIYFPQKTQTMQNSRRFYFTSKRIKLIFFSKTFLKSNHYQIGNLLHKCRPRRGRIFVEREKP